MHRLTILALGAVGLLSIGCARDADGDGFDEDVDCDDTNDLVSPRAAERCDGIDNDCDGDIDEGLKVDWYADQDGDGYGDPTDPITDCDAPEGFVAEPTDCDDTDARFHPGADESDCADPNDYNCDGSVGYEDADGDGWAACTECDDASDDVYPDAPELCDDIDNDCDDEVDEDPIDAPSWYVDRDGDGYGSDFLVLGQCDQPAGFVDNVDDCDDLDAAFHPGADESDCSDPNDYNCDGSVGFEDADGDGWSACTECDDADGAVNPDADEVCNEIDDDCSGEVDDGAVDAALWYLDSDGDGWGVYTDATRACEAPEGYAAAVGDCDDSQAAISPSADESCNDVDDDCDGRTDEDDAVDATTWYADEDGDGYGDSTAEVTSCDAPEGYVDDPTDCDDDDDRTHPFAEEVCNDGIDNDCDSGGEQCALDLGAATVKVLGEDEDDEAGYSISRVPDIDGDGTDDLLVGARGDDDGASNAGAAYLLLGPLTSGSLVDAPVKLLGEAANDRAGKALVGLDDMDGDGVPDLAIAAPSESSVGVYNGAVYLLSGADLGDGESSLGDAAVTLLGAKGYDYTGGVMATNDLDGDGLSDVIFTAIGNDVGASNAGAVYFIYGPVSATGTVKLSSALGTTIDGGMVVGADTNDEIGKALGSRVDLDADGYGEVAIGVADDDSSGTTGGAVFLVEGPMDGTVSVSDADAALYGAASGDALGGALAAADDIDGDGYPELLVGAALEDTAGFAAGAAYLVPGGVDLSDLDGQTASSVAVAVFYGAAAGDELGTSVAADGDLDGDGEADVLIGAQLRGPDDEGAAYLFYGTLTGALDADDADGVLLGEGVDDYVGGLVLFGGDLAGTGGTSLVLGVPGHDGAEEEAGAIYVVTEVAE